MRRTKCINIFIVAGLILSGCDEIDISYVPINPAPVIEQIEENVITIDLENVNQEIFGSYYSNYGTFEIENTEYEGYGIGTDANDDNELFVLRKTDSIVDIPVLESSFANVEGFDGINSICLDYESDSDFYVLYGNDRNNLEYSYQLPKVDDYAQYTVYLVENSSYFRIEAGDDDVYVHSVEIACSGNGKDETADIAAEGFRYVPDVDYSPEEGQVLSAPICEVDETGNVTVLAWKEYTYHSFDFVKKEVTKNGADEEEYALTEPVDVANYFVLFNRIPPNYGLSDKSDYDRTRIQGETESVSEVYDVFGPEYTRQVSEYSRSDGYMKKIPASTNNRTKTGMLYYEFDIDSDGKYTTDKRGTGRIVGVVGGLDTNADNTNTAFYTDDHYYTFTEYSNCGVWNDRFDAMGTCRTGRIYDFNKAEDTVEIQR